jgi:hypothetical protein
MKKTCIWLGVLLLITILPVQAQKQKNKEAANDTNTPLHLLQPDYRVPYGILSPEDVKKDIDRVFRYLDKATPAGVVDKNTGKAVTDYSQMDVNSVLERGQFRLASYEWGVAYAAMNDIAAKKYETLGIEKTKTYFIDRMHTNFDGSILHCKAAIEGLMSLKDYGLNKYVNPSALNREYKSPNDK